MNHLVQCTIPTGRDQQIYLARFRHKPSRVSLFRSHSYFDGMPDRAVSSDRCLERVIAGRFPVENQLNFFSS